MGCELGFSFLLYFILTLVFRCDAIRSKTQRQRKEWRGCRFNFNSKMTSFIGYINNTAIKLPIYFKSHMRIDDQIIDIIPKWIHVLIQDHGAYKQKCLYCFLTYLIVWICVSCTLQCLLLFYGHTIFNNTAYVSCEFC